MPYKTLTTLFLGAWAAFLLLTAAEPADARGMYNLPEMDPPEQFGNVLINRESVLKGVVPVRFSHWSHRRFYTCEVCHTELGFNMAINTTQITHEDQDNGRFCGACHDGKTAFSQQTECYSCHNPDPSLYERKYNVYFNSKPFVPTDFGNQVDWVQSLQRGLIKPKRFLNEETLKMNLDRDLELTAERAGISAVGFSHQPHLEWMSCDMCHPELFTIQKKGTDNLNMDEILRGRFCGACHLNVAFPIDNCKRCHPDMRSY